MLTYKGVIATIQGREKYLEESVESLRAQGLEPEIVYEPKWNAAKWNIAINTCDTDLLFLPHDDDVYGPDYIKEMVAFMEAHPECVAAFCFDKGIDGEGRRKGRMFDTGFPEGVPVQETFDFKTLLNTLIPAGNFLRCPSVCLRISLVADMRFPVDAGAGKAIDTAFWFLLASRHPIGIVNKQLMYYRIHAGQDSEQQRNAATLDHWKALEYGISLGPEMLDWKSHIYMARERYFNESKMEVASVKEKKDGRSVVLVVVHEAPDNAGTGVVAAHRVRETLKRAGEFAYYLFPDPDGTTVQEGFGRGCPVITAPPHLFQAVVNHYKPVRIEYHHLLVWGDGILAAETDAKKDLYLHDRWMWSTHPHTQGERRDVAIPEGIAIYANSPFLQAEAQENLKREVGLFDAFVPLPNDPMKFRKRVGFFGGFSETKGIHILLQAAVKLPDVLFVLFTQPPPPIMKERQIHGHPNVVVMGAYSRSDIHLLVSLVDVVAVPSTFESYGLVKREVESLGIPVIATNVGGMDGTMEPTVQALVEAIG